MGEKLSKGPFSQETELQSGILRIQFVDLNI